MMKKIYILTIVLAALGVMSFKGNFIKIDKPTDEIESEVTAYEPIVVLELFTSQGCSSCPSADLLLQKAKKEYKNEVFALSYHVDYWNYIGWEDPFSKAAYSKKQREYNVKFRNNSNYTPQLVVNGKEHFVGSSSVKMYGRIKAYKEKKAVNKISLKNISIAGNTASFDYELQGNSKGKNVRALLVIDERVTEVKRGENRNRTLKNSNVVVSEKNIGADASGAISVMIPKIVKEKDRLNLIVLVENADYDITAAAKRCLVR